MSIEIVEANLDQALWCFALEGRLSPERPNAATEGCLLPATEAEYQAFQTSALLRVAKVDGEPAGYLLALPPRHERLEKLRSIRTHFQLVDSSLLEDPKLLWIAKVAVEPNFSRRGIGSALYSQLFNQYPGHPMMTATLVAPIYNRASAMFHIAHGFREIGLMDGGDRGTIRGIVNSIVHRQPS